ncbi:MAG: DUF4340 domain-containing protein [Deltaproteobacteria bacterium]|nr:DUF4340 domain-containing protein [Candidatus Tharpella sp.]
MKKEYLLLVVAIIGLGALLFYQKKGRTNYQLPVMPVLTESVDRLTLEKAGQLIELRQLDGKWVVGSEQFPANASRIEKTIAEIRKVKLTALISEKKNYQLYELTPEKKNRVALYHGDKLLRELLIGKNSASFKQTYVMLKGDPKVYQALGNLKSNIFSSISEIRDKKVLDISQKKLDSLDEIGLLRREKGEEQVLRLIKVKPEVQAAAVEAGSDKAVEAPKPEAAWQFADGKPAAVDVVAQLLKNISDLQCESFIDDRQAKDFKDPVYRVVVKGGGEEFSLDLFAPEEGKYPALSSQNSYPFILPDWRAKKIVKDFAVYADLEKSSAR